MGGTVGGTNAVVRHDLGCCIGMADYFDLLAMLLQRPSPELIEGLIGKALVQDYRSIVGDCEIDCARVEKVCSELDRWCDSLAADGKPLMSVRRDYTRLFSHPTHPAIPPYEGLYIRRVLDPDSSAEEMLFVNKEALDSLEHFRRSGVTAKGEVKIPPDSITTQLEFLSYLEKKIARAIIEGNEEDVELSGGLLAAFVDCHVRGWFPSFFERCASEGDGGLYGFVGEMGLILIESQVFCRIG